MDRRLAFFRAFRAISARSIRVSYRSGYRAAARRYQAEVIRLSSLLSDSEDELESNRREAEGLQKSYKESVESLAESHDSKVRELRHQIAALAESNAIKDLRITQQAEIIERDRERVAAETAEASRRVIDVQHDPGIHARPVREQR